MINFLVGVAIAVAIITASVSFHARMRSWWTLSFLLFTILASIWFPLDQWAPLARLDDEPSGAKLALVDAVYWIATPALNLTLILGFVASLLGVALTVPRRSRG